MLINESEVAEATPETTPVPKKVEAAPVVEPAAAPDAAADAAATPEATDAAATPEAKEPVAADDAKELVNSLAQEAKLSEEPVEALDAEKFRKTEKHSAGDPDTPTLKLLDAEFDDVEELKKDGFYEKLDEKHIEKMDAYSKRILHNVRLEFKQALQHYKEADAKRDAAYKQRLASLSQRERDLSIEREKLSAWISDPKVQEALQTPTEELPPLSTPEGVQAYINKGIAEGLNKAFTPMVERYGEFNKEAEFRRFVSDHPEVSEDGFRGEMANIIREHKQKNLPITREDAYNLTKYHRMVKEQEKQKATALRARQTSGSKVTKRAASGAAAKPTKVPEEIRKKGGVAITKYLQAHPELAKKIRSGR